ncbi:phage tail protein [Mucilaginibacter terrigena]|uniref:Phage tail protein n=1 Tax=Mucilaginibacter terrigena TaxID=2492395 RepID=A0A4Q5LQQ8_9SPHI|nr:tail fiber protein [Mucilaginibacter terrigena]RYU91689.1 phage tail protein [Mucilaginibacter terrigena]
MEPLLGEIKMFAGNFAPNGWFTCEGQTLSINQYTALFSILGTSYGGDGVTTFQLPDLRSAFPTQCSNIGGNRRTPYSLGQIGGNQQVTITPQQMPAHSHIINTVTLGNLPQPNGNALAGLPVDLTTGEGTNNWSNAATDSSLSPATVAPTGGSQPVNITPPFLAMQYIIAWQGVYPSRP